MVYDSILLVGCLNAEREYCPEIIKYPYIDTVFSVGGEEFKEASKFKDMAKNFSYARDNCVLLARIFTSENVWFIWTVIYKYLSGLYVLVIF